MAGELEPDQARIEATLLGLAVADALGAPFEAFWADEAAAAVEGGWRVTGGGKWKPGWDPGEWTDDTAMALCLAECLGEKGLPLDLDDLARRYAAWAASGPKDIGMITSPSLAGIGSTLRRRTGLPTLMSRSEMRRGYRRVAVTAEALDGQVTLATPAGTRRASGRSPRRAC